MVESLRSSTVTAWTCTLAVVSVCLVVRRALVDVRVGFSAWIIVVIHGKRVWSEFLSEAVNRSIGVSHSEWSKNLLIED